MSTSRPRRPPDGRPLGVPPPEPRRGPGERPAATSRSSQALSPSRGWRTPPDRPPDGRLPPARLPDPRSPSQRPSPSRAPRVRPAPRERLSGGLRLCFPSRAASRPPPDEVRAAPGRPLPAAAARPPDRPPPARPVPPVSRRSPEPARPPAPPRACFPDPPAEPRRARSPPRRPDVSPATPLLRSSCPGNSPELTERCPVGCPRRVLFRVRGCPVDGAPTETAPHPGINTTEPRAYSSEGRLRYGSDPHSRCPAASYSPTRSPAQYHRR
jgi:hypothetical protein